MLIVLGCHNSAENARTGENATKSSESSNSKIGNLRKFWETRDLKETTKPILCGANRSGTVPKYFVTANHRIRPPEGGL